MKVRANRIGYYGHRLRHEGSVFIIKDKPLKKDGTPKELGAWMDEIKDPSVPVKDAKAGDAEEARKLEAAASAEAGEGGASDQDVI